MKKINFSNKTLIMSILNLSQNSFYPNSIKSIKEVRDVAYDNIDYYDILDIGAESTRPFSDPISSEEEIKLLEPVIKELCDFTLPISIDTYKSKTAKEMLKLGVDIINDVAGGELDSDMFRVISDYCPYYICGHIQNTPKDMQVDPQYDDVVKDIYNFFEDKIDKLTTLGFPKEKLILDPCIGFGKTLQDNIIILKNISEFKKLGFPVLIGTSRKGMHRNLVNINSDYDMLIATLASNSIAVTNGADIIRVHDPKEFKIFIDVLDELK